MGHAMNALAQFVVESSTPIQSLPLILATVWVIQNDFAVYSTSAMVMGQYSHHIRSYRYHNDLVDEILYRSMNPRADIELVIEGETGDNSKPKEIFSGEGRMISFEKSVWFLDSMEAYKKFEIDLLDPNRNYHRNGFFFIVYTGIEPQRLANVKEIFHRLLDIYVLNVNVMFMVGKYPYLYTYFPFAKDKCLSSKPEYFASFRGIDTNPNFTLTINMFPSKVKNMHGCEISVITWTYPPYIVVDKDEKTNELIRLHGIEGSLISLLSQVMNFKIRLIEPESKDRGDVYPNGTSTGATQMIIKGEANITIISYMYNKDRGDVMQASYNYLTLPYILAIPQGSPLTPFQRLVKPFRYIIWSCFSSSLFFAIIFIYSLRLLGKRWLMDFVYGRDNRSPFSNLLVILFGGAVYGNLPHRNFSRYLLTMWLLYTFVLRTAYTGQLFLILQDGKSRNLIESLQEVAEQNYTIYAFSPVEKVIKITDQKLKTKPVDASHTLPKLYERISKPNTKERIALCLLQYSILYYNQKNPARRVEILREPLLTSPIVFYMPKHSYLHFTFKDYIAQISAAGLMNRFVSTYLYEPPKGSGAKSEPEKLSCHVLLGLFAIYGVLLLFCFLIFLLELCSNKSMWVKYLLDFLNF